MSSLLNKINFFAKPQPDISKSIIVVSGLPRSGTSMMMKMLSAGGVEILSDGIRTADIDNPEGYYEFERVKQLPKGDIAWLPRAQGKAVKIIAALLEYLPTGYTYRVILMQRRMEEILASQRKMLVRRGEAADQVSDAEMAALFHKHLEKTRVWLATQPHITVLEMDYNTLLANPEVQADKITHFLDASLNMEQMVKIIDPQLYRNRSA